MLHLDGQLVVTPGDVVEHIHDAARTLDLVRTAHPPHQGSRGGAGSHARRKAGRLHKAAATNALSPDGEIHWISPPALDHDGFLAATDATIQAMRRGEPVIGNAVLYLPTGHMGLPHGRLVRPNALVRVERVSALGTWSYETVTTSLKMPKSAALMKIAVGADQLARVQGRFPAHARVLIPECEPLVIDATPLRAPIAEAWRGIDRQISRVLAIASPIAATNAVRAPAAPPTAAVTPPTGVAARPTQDSPTARPVAPVVRFRPLGGPTVGLQGLPVPTDFDITVDFEMINPARDSRLVFEIAYAVGDASELHHLSARTRREQADNFSKLLSIIEQQRHDHPEAHVVHKGHTEVQVMRDVFLDPQLGLRAAYPQLEAMIASRTFIDVGRTAKEAFTWSGGHGLKQYEVLTGFERHAEVRDGRTVQVHGQRWVDDPTCLHDLQLAQDYCAEDVLSTRSLHHYLDAMARRVEQFQLPPLPRAPMTPIAPTKRQLAVRDGVDPDRAAALSPEQIGLEVGRRISRLVAAGERSSRAGPALPGGR